MTIAIVGDFDPQIPAHLAIPTSLARAADKLQLTVEAKWFGTPLVNRLGARKTLAGFAGIWCVPGSPYMSMEGALDAIRHARENKVPFLGTCGGFQHAVIEIARNVLGIKTADHEETAPDAKQLLVQRLSCPLPETRSTVATIPGTRLAEWCGTGQIPVEYNCSFGLNPKFETQLADAGMIVTARDSHGAVRAIEWQPHPFHIGTLFQPERAIYHGPVHPLIPQFLHHAAGVGPHY